MEVELEVFMELREVITLQLFRRLSHCPHESRLTSQGSMTQPDHPSALWLKFFLTRQSFVAGHLGRNTHFPSTPLFSTGTSPSPCSGTSVAMPFCHCQEPTCGLWKAGSYLMEEPLALRIPNYFIWFFSEPINQCLKSILQPSPLRIPTVLMRTITVSLCGDWTGVLVFVFSYWSSCSPPPGSPCSSHSDFGKMLFRLYQKF